MERLTKPIVIGTVGSGYGAFLHVNGYLNAGGIPIRLKTLCARNREKAERFQRRYGYEQVCTDFEELLLDPEIDVIDLSVPPALHIPFSIRALKAGKHIICEKPVTGYFGDPEAKDIGKTMKKSEMWREVQKSLEELKQAVDASECKFMYAENFIYATPVQKAAEILRAKKSKIVLMTGEETIVGSSSPLAGKWRHFGGGSLMRNGIHPLTGMLYLKQVEAKARGEKITVKSVTADCGRQTACLSEEELSYINARPEDVEDVAMVTVTFSDGTKCMTICSDAVLGGSRNYINVYSNDTTMMCNLTPTDLLNTYAMDDKGLEEVGWGELVTSKTGWNKVFVSDEVVRGYTGEMKSFLESVAYGREPETGFDLAYEAIRVVYAAYQSAEEGRRIDF